MLFIFFFFSMLSLRACCCFFFYAIQLLMPCHTADDAFDFCHAAMMLMSLICFDADADAFASTMSPRYRYAHRQSLPHTMNNTYVACRLPSFTPLPSLMPTLFHLPTLRYAAPRAVCRVSRCLCWRALRCYALSAVDMMLTLIRYAIFATLQG